jgi:transcriptional regulator GlxA family with amidase domain
VAHRTILAVARVLAAACAIMPTTESEHSASCGKGASMGDPHLRTVGILIFDDVEVLDFCGPFEVLSVARPVGERDDNHRLFQVITIAEQLRTIRCCGGLLVQPHATIDDCPPLDVLLVPGGQGTRRERHNQHLLRWITARDAETELTVSVCTGAFLLAEAGLLDGRRATTHWASVEWMRETYPAITMLADARVVDEGRIVTSAGISAGIDMSLHLVARLHGEAVAEWTARRMEYDWRR